MMKTVAGYDELYMRTALSLARKGWGKTSINPLVGAVIVRQDRIVGKGFHRRLGEAHAEIIALRDAGQRARNATLYVTLEPCCCTGRTPPCVPALIAAGIKRIIIAMRDPNPQVNGKSIELLRKNNIAVTLDVLAEEAARLNRGYIKYITRKIPYIIMKIAVSRNGMLSGYGKRYVTSDTSRRFVHSLRSQVSAVLVGITTVVADDPRLTDRFIGRNNPARVIIDPQLRIPVSARCLTNDARRVIITKQDSDKEKMHALSQRGVEFIVLTDTRFSTEDMLEALADNALGSILVEGGAKVFEQFFHEDNCDEIYLFRAPIEVEQGLPLAHDLLNAIIKGDETPQECEEDLVYHVYRHN